MKTKYPVDFLCRIMDLNRSGYYKWKKRQGQLNRYEKDRICLTELLKAAHAKHPSYGYHRLAEAVFQETGWAFSHHLAHQRCKTAGIASKARKYCYHPPGEESVKFPNEVKGHWNAKEPLEIVVSDMTMFKVGTTYWEWTILLDTFNNEILAHSVTAHAGSNKPYYHCLDALKALMDKREEQTPQVVFHTDQGAVYSSQAFCQAHHDYNILRSMSRGGTPTDNPIIEALNGWIKDELYLDFHLASAKNVPALLDSYVHFFNHRRPAAALGYKTPVQFKTDLGF
ncbi:transposase [Oscillospiraceae bacterium]|nr:transposase [Oscillospiraceae bacterium]